MNSDRLYAVIQAPHISEKASDLNELANMVTFRVRGDASKTEIKEAVETLYNVTVVSVRTLNRKPKYRRTVRGLAKRQGFKKAYVRLAKGQEIDFTEIA